MNRTAFIYSILYLFFAIYNVAFGQSNPSVIEGLWLIEIDLTFQGFGKRNNILQSKMSENSKTRIKHSLESRSYDFKNDNVVFINFLANGNKRIAKGKWEFNPKDNTLTIVMDGISKDYIVIQEKPNLLRIESKTPYPNSILSSFYLVRKN